MDREADTPVVDKGAAPRPRPKGSVLRRLRLVHWGWILLGLAGLLFIALALLPAILSTDTAREMILARVNRHINGRLTVRDWGLGWFSGIAMEDVRIEDADKRRLFEAKAVIISADIPGLVRKKKRFRSMLIDQPRVLLLLGPDGRPKLPDLIRQPAPAPAATAPAAEEAGGLPSGFDMRTGLIIRDGQLTLIPDDGGAPLVVRSVDAGAQINSLTQPARLNGRFLLDGAAAPVSVEGDVTLMPEDAPQTRRITGELTARAKQFHLDSLAPVTLRLDRPFSLTGTADFNLKTRFDGARDLHAELQLDARDVELKGAASDAKAPRIPRLALTCALTRAGDALRFERLRLESAMADVDATGELLLSRAPGPLAGRVSGKLRADLAMLGEAFPHLLDMPEGFVVKGGTLHLSGEAARDAGTAHARLEARAERLELTARGKRLLLDNPLTVTLAGERTPRGANIERFVLACPYGRVTAWGTTEAFECHLAADLTRLSEETARFIDLRGAGARGRAEVHLRVTSPGLRSRRGELAVELKDFNLTGLTRKPLAFRSASLTAAAVADFDDRGRLLGARDVVVALSGPAFAVRVAAAAVAPRAEGRLLPDTRDAEVAVEGNLANALAMAQGSGTLPGLIEIKGDLRLHSDLQIADGVLRAEKLDASLGELTFAIMEQRVVEPAITLQARGFAVRPESRNFALREAQLKTSWSTTRLDNLVVTDWSAFPRGAAARARMDLNLDRVKDILRRIDLLPTQFDVMGQVQAGAELSSVADAPHLKLSLVATDLKLLTGEEPPVDEKRVSIDLDGLRRDETGLSADNVTVASTYFSLSGKARLLDAVDPPELETEGALVIDLDQLSPVLARLLRRPITMSGRHAGPFKMTTLLVPGGWRQRLLATQARAALHADLIAAYGMNAAEVAAELRDDKGLVELDMKGKVNTGPMSARLILDARKDPAVIRTPNPQLLFADARLAPDALAETLGRLNPLFRGAAAPRGTVALSLSDFAAPVVERMRNQMAVAGALEFKGVSFSPGPYLRRALAVALTAEVARVQLPDQTVAFTLREGVLQHEPLTLKVGNLTLRAQTVKRRDGTLTCVVDIPCTLDIADRDKALYEAMKSDSFRLTFSGPVEDPAPDLRAFEAQVILRRTAARARLARDRAAQELERAVDDLFRAE